MAIELPKSTEFNKKIKIPKQKFYENLEISPALKKIFIEQVDKIRPNRSLGHKYNQIAKFKSSAWQARKQRV